MLRLSQARRKVYGSRHVDLEQLIMVMNHDSLEREESLERDDLTYSNVKVEAKKQRIDERTYSYTHQLEPIKVCLVPSSFIP